MADLFDSYPYAERYGVNRSLPEQGRSREEILAELRTIGDQEDAVWRAAAARGRCTAGTGTTMRS